MCNRHWLFNETWQLFIYSDSYKDSTSKLTLSLCSWCMESTMSFADEIEEIRQPSTTHSHTLGTFTLQHQESHHTQDQKKQLSLSHFPRRRSFWNRSFTGRKGIFKVDSVMASLPLYRSISSSWVPLIGDCWLKSKFGELTSWLEFRIREFRIRFFPNQGLV